MNGRPLNVVIAEDDVFVAEILVEQLKAIGFQVVGRASDGRQAVELVCSRRPDVVLMDVRMPELDGIEASRRIQQACPTPIVILTAHAEPDILERATEAGVGAYLVKPSTAPEILRAVTVARARFEDMASLRRVNEDLRKALEGIRTLSGLLPICSSCKRIRDDRGYWQKVENYLREHSSTQFSHGICPSCLQKSDPELYAEMVAQDPTALGKLPPE